MPLPSSFSAIHRPDFGFRARQSLSGSRLSTTGPESIDPASRPESFDPLMDALARQRRRRRAAMNQPNMFSFFGGPAQSFSEIREQPGFRSLFTR